MRVVFRPGRRRHLTRLPRRAGEPSPFRVARAAVARTALSSRIARQRVRPQTAGRSCARCPRLHKRSRSGWSAGNSCADHSTVCLLRIVAGVVYCYYALSLHDCLLYGTCLNASSGASFLDFWHSSRARSLTLHSGISGSTRNMELALRMIDGEEIGKVMLSTTMDTASHKVRSKVACAALVCTRVARAALLSQFAGSD